jgi:hypothetical protein
MKSTMNASSSGFLVVLLTREYRPEESIDSNPRYLGVSRIPAYPSEYKEEECPLDDYVFGAVKSRETNLIPDYDGARRLLHRFAVSPRAFEIIFCCSDPEDAPLKGLGPDSVVALGYDVATIRADYWSIVEDLVFSPWAQPFQQRLNEYGLLPNKADAARFLQEYRNHQEADCEAPFEIICVMRVLG